MNPSKNITPDYNFAQTFLGNLCIEILWRFLKLHDIPAQKKKNQPTRNLIALFYNKHSFLLESAISNV